MKTEFGRSDTQSLVGKFVISAFVTCTSFYLPEWASNNKLGLTAQTIIIKNEE